MDIKVIASLATVLTALIGVCTTFISKCQYDYALYCFILFIIVLFYGLYKFFNRNTGITNLLKHPFFSDMEFYITFFIPKLKIEHQKKSKMIKKALRIKFEKVLKIYYEQSKEIKEFDLCNEIRIVNQISEEYKKEWKANNIPEIFFEKFDEWHTTHLELLLRMLQDIANSKFYITDLSKHHAKLDLVKAIMIMTVISAENTMNDFNGQLEKAIEECEKK